jgi:thymidylate kinase
MPVISIEGNIGSGKSTLLKKIRDFYPEIITIQEPVDEWNTIVDEHGKTILELYYSDQKKWAFAFQMMAFITRAKNLREAVEKNPDKLIIIERSVYTDKYVFATMLRDSGIMNDVEFSIYSRWFDELSRNLPINKLIYVRTDPTECEWRIKCRNRAGESIPLEYLKKCHTYHEDWLRFLFTNGDKLILNGELTTDEMFERVRSFL